jgi:predicted MFS family arabinose efflux permease
MVAYLALAMIIICMDRGALASVIVRLKDSSLGISNVQAGALSSVFVLGFMISSPLYGWGC